MINQMSLFSQLLNLLPRRDFDALVKTHQSDYQSKGFHSFDQLVCMVFCHLGQAQSLREICFGLESVHGKLPHLGVSREPKKSTLAYANEHRSYQLFEDFFYHTLTHVHTLAPGLGKKKKKFRFKNQLLSLDSTKISLCLGLFPWAKCGRKKGGVKLHMLLDHGGYLPTFASLTLATKSDLSFARTLSLPSDSIITMDKGYTDYRLFGQWSEQKVWFVTRLKFNAVYEVVEQRQEKRIGHILSDEIIRLSSPQARKKCPHLLRRIVVWDEENGREIELLSNHLEFAASTLSAIYKDRWEIELFFKTLKQKLKIKTFVGTSENAIQIQIWTALLTLLLLKYMIFKSRMNWSFSNLVALLRFHLFTHRNLQEWLDDPFLRPPENSPPQQRAFDFTGSGQHHRGRN